MMGLSAGGLSELIGAIYDRALDPTNWAETLGHIRVALGAENAGLSLIDLRTNAFLLSFVENMPAGWTARIEEWSSEIIDAWGGPEALLAHPLDEPAVWSRVVSQPPSRENSYTQAMISGGMADAMTLGLARDHMVIGACVFGRARKSGPFREDELEVARLLLPHLQRAIAISRILELATVRSAGFEAALDAVAAPTILVTAKSELVHANAAAHALLERGDVLRVCGGRIAVADWRYQRRLTEALTIASKRPEGPPDKLDVEVGADKRRIRFLPLPAGSARGTLNPSAAAAILLPGWSEPCKGELKATASRLVDRHGLTKAESAVAIEIAKGDGRAGAAARLGISENTVRTHLSAIFQKVGISRQAQLVHLVNEAGGLSGV